MRHQCGPPSTGRGRAGRTAPGSSSPSTAAPTRRSAWGFDPTWRSATSTRSRPEASTALRAAGIPVEVAPEAKDESDTELAIRAALARAADAITIVGGLGGRPDHLLANVGLLALEALGERPVELLDERTRISIIRGPGRRELRGRDGDLVSLLPFGSGVDGVSTDGLAWRLVDEALPIGPARGLSNVRVGLVASVAIRSGWLVVVETVVEAAAR